MLPRSGLRSFHTCPVCFLLIPCSSPGLTSATSWSHISIKMSANSYMLHSSVLHSYSVLACPDIVRIMLPAHIMLLYFLHVLLLQHTSRLACYAILYCLPASLLHFSNMFHVSLCIMLHVSLHFSNMLHSYWYSLKQIQFSIYTFINFYNNLTTPCSFISCIAIFSWGFCSIFSNYVNHLCDDPKLFSHT